MCNNLDEVELLPDGHVYKYIDIKKAYECEKVNAVIEVYFLCKNYGMPNKSWLFETQELLLVMQGLNDTMNKIEKYEMKKAENNYGT